MVFTYNPQKHLPPNDALSVCDLYATCFRHRFSYADLLNILAFIFWIVNNFSMYGLRTQGKSSIIAPAREVIK